MLYRSTEDSLVNHQFRIYNLETVGMGSELTFNLGELVPSAHMYGDFNRNLQFVGFSQGAA